MNNLQVLEQNGQRVLTTAQLAEAYGTDSKIINRNFQRNSERYTPGKHYFSLTGEDLKQFKGSRQFDDSLKFTSVLYLWTEKGAWLHAKSLNTDQAWNAYEKLVDEYYRITKELQPNNTKLLLQTALKHEEEIEEIRTDVKYLKNSMRIDGGQEYQINLKGKLKVLECLGGKDSNAYLSISKKIFSQFWRDFKKYFEIPRYGDLPKSRYEEALSFIEEWSPDTSSRLEIKAYNEQQTLEIG